MKNMTRNLTVCILCTVLLLTFTNQIVLADTGPKPFVTLDIHGLEGETYYVTLLSKASSNGPWNTDNTYGSWSTDNLDVWQAMHNYRDTDGFYFLGKADNCSDSNTFSWNYYPPDTFKVLIYLPESNRFIVSSKSYDCYAFSSLFKATVHKDDIVVEKAGTVATEGLHILDRIILTLFIELGIAYLFGYRKRLHYLIITITNIITQLLLNVILFSIIQHYGKISLYYLCFLMIEFVIPVIEGLVYQSLLKRPKEGSDFAPNPWLYSFCANIASFLIGIVVTAMLPGIF